MPLSVNHPSVNLAAEPESDLKPEAEPEQQGQGANSIYTGKIVVHNVMSEDSIPRSTNSLKWARGIALDSIIHKA